ncbi:Crp/Fnr family transcriptional regulator [Mucilaginibacter gossypii]|uniref:cAMP-binding domain of CRP or a regulatory subunit of cAMP-dependent protein kinases n=1 Tax=Mucilaginibacter gossypii TaxID=551996 RepID=A0A1G8CRV6_9SPHI|nr:Crp/Fnr family transcriptional regulator [Mucilaginibacter gossypii]SDH48235.1 cAMP-binding domain of CRP or a regulatory subunit of cAMP-dependent protein kinases [Mucilaginibacter gossypii]
MNQLIKFVEKYIDLEEDERILIANALTVKKYAPNEFILANKKICKAILFVISGSARSVFVNGEGQEYTWSFYFNDEDSTFDNYFIFDFNSFLQQTPTPLTFQAITEIEAIELHYEKLQKLLRQFPKMQELMRIMAEQCYQVSHKKAFTLLTLSAKERYLNLLRETPYLLNKFQHYLIASHLGIAPQSLSRLRAEISRR